MKEVSYMTLAELIGIYRSKNGYSLEEVGDFCGVSKSTVSRWESGAIKNIQADKKESLSKLFNIDVEDYLKHRFFKPVLGSVRAGYSHLVNPQYDDYLEVSKEDYDRGDYYLEVVGDSMINARIHDGDYVLIKQTSSVQSGDIALILIEDEEVTIKKIIIKKDLLILEAANPSYETQYFTPSEVQSLPVKILGKVLSVRMEF